jgi:hypothetical protein
MAAFLSWLKKLPETGFGAAASVLLYAVMLALILIFFTGHGAFIYEGF